MRPSIPPPPTSYATQETLIDLLDGDRHSGGSAQSEAGCDSDAEVDDQMEDSDAEDPVPYLENLVLSCLSQLVSAVSVTAKPASAPPCASQANMRPKCIQLEVVDRRKYTEQARSRTLQVPRTSKSGSGARNLGIFVPQDIHCDHFLNVLMLAQLLKVADAAHEALLTDVGVTKRDLYYQDVSLFGRQPVVDNLVDDLAATFELPRPALNIHASGKGLFCGSALKFHLAQGSAVVGNDSQASLIPRSDDIVHTEVEDDVQWILVIEKEAVFQTLCGLEFSCDPALPGRGIIITGKGYPDLVTRQLVKMLSDNLLKAIPILALVDGDAHGLDIVSVYKYGSKSMRHYGDALSADRIEWIGVFGSELESLGIGKEALLPINIHDEKKALSMLQSDRALPETWRKELQYMLHDRRKAEIEVLSSVPLAIDVNRDSSSSRNHPLVSYLVPKLLAALES